MPHPPQWHVLLTSREKLTPFKTLFLDRLSEENAIRLFKLHYKKPADDAAIVPILKLIAYHTLTIELTAKTAQKLKIDLVELNNKLKNRGLKWNEISRVEARHSNFKPIEQIFPYLLEIFDLAELSPSEQQILKIFTGLPSRFIRFELLQQLLADFKNVNLKDYLLLTLSSLVDKSWLLYNEKEEGYKMHLIIQEVILELLQPGYNDLYHLIKYLTQKLSLDQTKDNPVDKFKWIEFGMRISKMESLEFSPRFSFWERLQGKDKQLKRKTEIAISRLNNNLALVLQDLGDYEGAKSLLEKAMQSAERHFGVDHPKTALRYWIMASLHKDLGQLKMAKEWYQKAYPVFIKKLGPDHPHTQSVKKSLDDLSSE